MNRRLFLRSSTAAAAGLIVGDAALEMFDRLRPRSLFAFPINPPANPYPDPSPFVLPPSVPYAELLDLNGKHIAFLDAKSRITDFNNVVHMSVDFRPEALNLDEGWYKVRCHVGTYIDAGMLEVFRPQASAVMASPTSIMFAASGEFLADQEISIQRV